MSSLWSDPFELLTKGFPRLRVASLDLPDGVWRPKVDFKQSDKEITIHFDVPGVTSKQLNVEVHEGVLTISGEKTIEKPKEGEKVYSERFSGKFSRSFSIPAVQSGDIKASLDNGVLTVVVPIPEKEKAKKIDIRSKL